MQRMDEAVAFLLGVQQKREASESQTDSDEEVVQASDLERLIVKVPSEPSFSLLAKSNPLLSRSCGSMEALLHESMDSGALSWVQSA